MGLKHGLLLRRKNINYKFLEVECSKKCVTRRRMKEANNFGCVRVGVTIQVKQRYYNCGFALTHLG
jgi:hypothetical protein